VTRRRSKGSSIQAKVNNVRSILPISRRARARLFWRGYEPSLRRIREAVTVPCWMEAANRKTSPSCRSMSLALIEPPINGLRDDRWPALGALSIIEFCQFRPSQFSAHSKAGFLGDAASPMESTIRSSEKSNSPCKLKCCQVTAEPWRMASISSARRFSFFSAATSRER
jgi:hypothetical protein